MAKLINIIWKARLAMGFFASNAMATLFIYGWYTHHGLQDYDLVSNLFGFLCLVVAVHDWYRFVKAAAKAVKKAHAEYRVVFRIEKVATATSKQI